MPGHIRHATPADLPAVGAFERAYIQEIEPHHELRWTENLPRHLTQWTENLPRMFVAVQDDQTVGHCFWQPEGERAVLASLYVVPASRRQGWGTALLLCFERDAHAQGFARLALGVQEDNPARRLYAGAGYRETDAQDGYILCEKAAGEGALPPPPDIPSPVDTPPTV